MYEETKRVAAGGGKCESVFSYGEEHLSLNELLEKVEILKYLRRKGVERSRSALRKRLRKGLRDGSITKEIVMEYARRAEPIPTPKPILRVGSKTKPIPPPRVGFEILVSTTKPTPAPRTKPIPTQETRPVPIPRKIMSKLNPTPPPRRRREKPVPPPRKRKEKPAPPSRLQKPRWLTCDHGTAEETDGSIFCIHCGLEIDQQPYRKEESRDDRVLRGLTLRKATLKELVLPSGRIPPENVHMISKYEKARVIGVRATQIANGARPKCSTEGITNSLDIATREFEQGLTPYVFKRRTGPRKPKSVGGTPFGKERKG